MPRQAVNKQSQMQEKWDAGCTFQGSPTLTSLLSTLKLYFCRMQWCIRDHPLIPSLFLRYLWCLFQGERDREWEWNRGAVWRKAREIFIAKTRKMTLIFILTLSVQQLNHGMPMCSFLCNYLSFFFWVGLLNFNWICLSPVKEIIRHCCLIFSGHFPDSSFSQTPITGMLGIKIYFTDIGYV